MINLNTFEQEGGDDEGFEITWKPFNHIAINHTPDPSFPGGVTLMEPGMKEGATITCSTSIPYPAKGVGVWTVKCLLCGRVATCNARGLDDDPRQMILKCNTHPHSVIKT